MRVPAATAPVHRRHQCLQLVGVNDELGHDSTESYLSTFQFNFDSVIALVHKSIESKLRLRQHGK